MLENELTKARGSHRPSLSPSPSGLTQITLRPPQNNGQESPPGLEDSLLLLGFYFPFFPTTKAILNIFQRRSE